MDKSEVRKAILRLEKDLKDLKIVLGLESPRDDLSREGFQKQLELELGENSR